MGTEAITRKHVELMEHALGLNYTRQSHRNHFISYEEGDDTAAWRELVKLGAATEEKYFGADSSLMFRVTDKGKRLVRERSRKAARMVNENHN